MDMLRPDKPTTGPAVLPQQRRPHAHRPFIGQGPRTLAEVALLSSASQMAWVAGDWLIEMRAPVEWVVPNVGVAEPQ
jgi:hypothetical protein